MRELPFLVSALIGFFAFGAFVSGLTCLALALPTPQLNWIWLINPGVEEGLVRMGGAAIALVAGVSTAFASACVGLARRRKWGYWLSVGILVTNGISDMLAAMIRGEPLMLVGVVVAAVMVAYLRRQRVRRLFD